MYITIPYNEAIRDYPDEVNKIVRKIRSGKGKRKDESPENYTWQLCIGEAIEDSGSLFEMLNGIKKPQKPLEERLFVSLRGEIGKSWCNIGFDKVPDKVIAVYMMREITGS